MLISNVQFSLEVSNLSLQVCNYLGDVNGLWLGHGSSIRSTSKTGGTESTHTHTKENSRFKQLPKPFVRFA